MKANRWLRLEVALLPAMLAFGEVQMAPQYGAGLHAGWLAFLKGNGRLSRLAADLLVVRLGQTRFDRGATA